MSRLWWRIPWLLVASISLGMLTGAGALEFLTLTVINPMADVRQLMAEERYAAAAAQVRYFLDLTADEKERQSLEGLAAEIAHHRSGLAYQADKIVTEGILSGQSDEIAGQMAAGISAMMVIGDVRDLLRQGVQWVRNEPVDEVVITLATLGVVASASQVVSLGTTTPLKVGLGVLAVAHKVGALPAWLRANLKQGLGRMVATRSLTPVATSLTRVHELTQRLGLGPTLTLLGQTRGPGSLNRLVLLARHLGAATGPLVRLGGDASLELAPRLGQVGVLNVKQASRFGREGLAALRKPGVIRFVKYGERLAKLALHYPWLVPIAKWLLKMPARLWQVGLVLGLLLGLPWPWRRWLFN